MESKPGNKFGSYAELSKLKIMIPVSFTGFTGYFIKKPEISPGIFLVTAGILFLAVSASVLNQIQEADIDALMKRTRNRPLPTGRIKIRNAQVYFFLNLAAGTLLVFAAGNVIAALTGLFAVLWYNGVYTNAKRLTAYAIIPGSLTGALPPLIGWLAAGGSPFDRTILFLELLFFIGQIPHFLLLIIKYGEEYEKASIPVISRRISHGAMNRITFALVAASVVTAIFLCYHAMTGSGLIIACLIASVLLLWQFSGLLRKPLNGNSCMKYFNSLDSYFLLVLILLISDKII